MSLPHGTAAGSGTEGTETKPPATAVDGATATPSVPPIDAGAAASDVKITTGQNEPNERQQSAASEGNRDSPSSGTRRGRRRSDLDKTESQQFKRQKLDTDESRIRQPRLPQTQHQKSNKSNKRIDCASDKNMNDQSEFADYAVLLGHKDGDKIDVEWEVEAPEQPPSSLSLPSQLPQHRHQQHRDPTTNSTLVATDKRRGSPSTSKNARATHTTVDNSSLSKSKASTGTATTNVTVDVDPSESPPQAFTQQPSASTAVLPTAPAPATNTPPLPVPAPTKASAGNVPCHATAVTTDAMTPAMAYNEPKMEKVWWTATILKWNGKRSDEGYVIRQIEYEALPQYGFEEKSVEEVMFMTDDLLVSVQDPNEVMELKYRRHRKPGQSIHEDCEEDHVYLLSSNELDEHLNKILIESISKHYPQWNKLSAARQAEISEKVMQKKERLKEVLQSHNDIITSADMPALLQKALR